MEFSKKIFIALFSLFSVALILSFVLMFKTNDSTPLSYIIPSITGMLTIGVSFYYWKARTENCIKLKKENKLTADELSVITKDDSAMY